MLPSTLIGLVAVVIAVLPGSVYTWAYERQASSYGVTRADRTLRFFGVSAVFHLLLGWPEYALYRLSVAHRHDVLVGQFALLWAGLVLLIAIPASAGSVIGGLYASRTNRDKLVRVRKWLSADREASLLRLVLGRDPAPRAWDNLFSVRPTLYLRVKTTDQTWLAGLFADRSYAGGFPNETDLYLEEAWAIDNDGALGDKSLGYALYVPASKIEMMEIVSLPQEGEPDVEE
jgi:Family of unknown function (DUF6338)